MTQSLNLLDRVRIASPCSASWSDMAGDDRVRFCMAAGSSDLIVFVTPMKS